MKDLAEIKTALSIDSFEKLTNDQMTEIMKLHGKGAISIGQLEQIAAIAPHFATVAAEAAKTLAEVAKAAGASQQSALTEIGKTRDAIVSLAAHPKASEHTLHLIIEKLSELAGRIEAMNGSNNGLWEKAKSVLALIGVGLLGLIAVGIASENSGKA